MFFMNKFKSPFILLYLGEHKKITDALTVICDSLFSIAPCCKSPLRPMPSVRFP